MRAIQSFCNSSFALLEAFRCSGVRDELNRVPSTTSGRTIRVLGHDLEEVIAMEVLKAARSILCTGLGASQDHDNLSTLSLIIIARDSVGDCHLWLPEALLRLVTNFLKFAHSSTPFTRRFTLFDSSSSFIPPLLPPLLPRGFYVLRILRTFLPRGRFFC